MVGLRVLPDRYAVCRLPSGTTVPPLDYPRDGLISVTATPDELSIVCPASQAPPGATAESGWMAFAVDGPLDFSLVGVLAAIARPLADASISIFAVSTYDTDYILVAEEDMMAAVTALRTAGHRVDGADAQRSAPLN